MTEAGRACARRVPEEAPQEVADLVARCISEPERRPTAEQCAEVISSFLPGVARKTSGRTASGEVGRFKRASSGAQPKSPVCPRPSRAAATRPSRPAATHRNRLEALRPDQAAAAGPCSAHGRANFSVRFAPARIADLPLRL